MLIAVDCDGTIVMDCFPNRPTTFLPGAKETLIDLNNLGHILVLWTLRDNTPYFSISLRLAHAFEFLKLNGIMFMKRPCEVINNDSYYWKFPADLFIEDKTPGGFCGWDTVRKHFGLSPLVKS